MVSGREPCRGDDGLVRLLVRPSRGAATISSRLLARLRAELRPLGVIIPEGAGPRRVNASAADRCNGAWSWCMEPALWPDGSTVGSNYPMGVMARCAAWRVSRISQVGSYGDFYVDPCDACITRHGRVRF